MLPRFRLRRSSPTVAILLLTVGLAGVLTYEAWDSARSHRATAEGALRDYASFAAWEFSLSAKEELYMTLVSIFSPVSHEEPARRGAALEPPWVLAHSLTDRVLCPNQTRYFFRLDLPQRRLVIDGQRPTPQMQRWIRDTIVADLIQYQRDWSYSTVSG